MSQLRSSEKTRKYEESSKKLTAIKLFCFDENAGPYLAETFRSSFNESVDHAKYKERKRERERGIDDRRSFLVAIETSTLAAYWRGSVQSVAVLEIWVNDRLQLPRGAAREIERNESEGENEDIGTDRMKEWKKEKKLVDGGRRSREGVASGGVWV